LWVYTAAGVDRLAEQLERSASSDELTRCNRRKCFSRLQCVHETNGSFTLPADLVEAAALKTDLLLIGVRDHFELWDAHQWQQYIGQEEPAEPPASETAAPPHPGYGLAPVAAPTAIGVNSLPGELAVHYEIQQRQPGVVGQFEIQERSPASLSQVLIIGNGQSPTLSMRKMMQSSGPGWLRRASFSVDRQPAYILENGAGRPVLYVTAQAGLNLEPYVNRTVELLGSVIYHDLLQTSYMTAAQARLLQ
jgi:hypothetical protein